MADKLGVKLLSKPFETNTGQSERRMERRLLCSNLVQISWYGLRGHHRSEIGVLEDLSRSGFGLSVFMSTPLERGTQLSIIANRVEFTGCVMRSKVRENGYLVGLELDNRRGWCDGPAPEHLLDVTLLDLG